MTIGNEHVGKAVEEVERGADHPQHVASVVGAFMQRQPMIGHYVQAHTSDVGVEGMVLVLLHASVLARAVEIARGRRHKVVQARDLDAATSSPGSSEKALKAEEPELYGYLEGNVTDADPTLGGKRHKIALGLLRVIARALLDT